MTQAIKVLKKTNISYTLHEYSHDKHNSNYGLEASELLNVEESLVFKTLVVQLENKDLVTLVIPVIKKLNMKKVASHFKVKKAKMASQNDVVNSSGYIMGAVSAIGQKRSLKTLIDVSAKELAHIYISAGKRGLEIQINPNDLKQITNSQFIDIC